MITYHDAYRLKGSLDATALDVEGGDVEQVTNGRTLMQQMRAAASQRRPATNRRRPITQRTLRQGRSVWCVTFPPKGETFSEQMGHFSGIIWVIFRSQMGHFPETNGSFSGVKWIIFPESNGSFFRS